MNSKVVEIAILILDKIDIKTKITTRDLKGHFTIVKGQPIRKT